MAAERHGGAPFSAVDLPGLVRPLNHVEGDLARCNDGTLMAMAYQPPAVGWDTRNAAVAGEPGGG
jgi:hypothetical protein